MNTELFIAKRLSYSKTKGNRLSQLMSKIAVVSIALSLTVMIISVAVLTGFKYEIKNKLTGFNAHMRITNFDSNSSFETVPISNKYDFLEELKQIQGVKHVQQYATKGGIIKANSDIQGVVLKGISTDFDWSFFSSYLEKGEVFTVNDSSSVNQVLISETLSQLLNLNVGDSFETYFVQDPIRVRKFTISGIYSTHFEELDRTFILCDIKHIQRLNNWTRDQISGFEVILDDIEKLPQLFDTVDDLVSYTTYDDGSRLTVNSIQNMFPQLFNWLSILDMNVIIILVLMLLVSGFNMVSGLLIMLLEKASMIGILKALGMKNWSLQKVFVYRSAFIVLRGMFWGNAIGITCCLLQQYFGIFKLNPENYYFTIAPVQLNVLHILLLNACSFIIIVLFQLFPSMFVAKISPDKTIRFD